VRPEVTARRRRALLFGLLALLAAGLAAAIVDGYRASVSSSYGPLRPVVVTAQGLPARAPLSGGRALRTLEVRRVPARFAPPGALASPAQALGLAPLAPIPPGAYLLRSQLRPPGGGRKARRPGLGNGRSPVQIAVAGAGALLRSGGGGGAAVDVVVTTEPGANGRARTYVAAPEVPLLDLGPAGGPAGPGTAMATLGLTRSQALELIEAESYARQIRLLPRPATRG
jgi:Flp pilus assembly protein CpaB